MSNQMSTQESNQLRNLVQTALDDIGFLGMLLLLNKEQLPKTKWGQALGSTADKFIATKEYKDLVKKSNPKLIIEAMLESGCADVPNPISKEQKKHLTELLNI